MRQTIRSTLARLNHKLKSMIRRLPWSGVLVSACLLLAVLNVYAFYPGFLSNDSIDQLMQARGVYGFHDWHPPIMAMVWRVLLKVSGGLTGSIVIFQIALLWTALCLLAAYVYKETASRRYSLLPLLLGVLPFVVNISGVIWKDVQLAFALALAVGLLLWCARLSRRLKYAALAVAGCLLVYAINLRYNALLAVLPLFGLLHYARFSRRQIAAFAGVIVVGAVMLTPLLGLVKDITARHPAVSIMADDIAHLYTGERLGELKQNHKEVAQIVQAMNSRCDPSKVLTNYLLLCGMVDERELLTGRLSSDVQEAWLKAIAGQPLVYAQFRLNAFLHFMEPDNTDQAYVWHDGIVENTLGLTFRPNWLTNALESYVKFVAFNFGFLYRPYTWLIIGVATAYVAWRRRSTWKHAVAIVSLSLSGVLYILTYIPLSIGNDFRYIYWSCLAISIALVLSFIDQRAAGLPSRHKARK